MNVLARDGFVLPRLRDRIVPALGAFALAAWCLFLALGLAVYAIFYALAAVL